MASNARAGAILSFDLDAEEVWLGENPDTTNLPVTLSQGRYEFTVAVPEIMRMLKNMGVITTFFVPGRVSERYPEAIEQIVSEGHELAHHGYTHRTPSSLSISEEREEIERGLEALSKFGVPINGYRAPSWDMSEHTLDLVAEYGLTYSSNFMDDIRQYRHENGVVELPVSWILDDAAHFWFSGDETWLRKISTNSEVHEIMTAELRGITRLQGLSVFTFHGQLIGRPGRLELLERLIADVVDMPDVEFLTCDRAVRQFYEREC